MYTLAKLVFIQNITSVQICRKISVQEAVKEYLACFLTVYPVHLFWICTSQ